MAAVLFSIAAADSLILTRSSGSGEEACCAIELTDSRHYASGAPERLEFGSIPSQRSSQ
ncbi:MAG: hypothetical protein ACI841_000494 [Planctomycetota bacterium]|jgi:hypothetical protein